jgi:hypothetical protein
MTAIRAAMMADAMTEVGWKSKRPASESGLYNFPYNGHYNGGDDRGDGL